MWWRRSLLPSRRSPFFPHVIAFLWFSARGCSLVRSSCRPLDNQRPSSSIEWKIEGISRDTPALDARPNVGSVHSSSTRDQSSNASLPHTFRFQCPQCTSLPARGTLEMPNSHPRPHQCASNENQTHRGEAAASMSAAETPLRSHSKPMTDDVDSSIARRSRRPGMPSRGPDPSAGVCPCSLRTAPGPDAGHTCFSREPEIPKTNKGLVDLRYARHRLGFLPMVRTHQAGKITTSTLA